MFSGNNLVNRCSRKGALLLCCTVVVAADDPCEPHWSDVFPAGGDTNGSTFALTSHDDGTGPALYVGGNFTAVGSVQANRIARWDGSEWSALGTGTSGAVRTLAVFDDGSGPALYAGGAFASAGGQSAARIANWDGESWSPLGAGVNHHVLAMAVFDDGTGPALYVGGFFTEAGGKPANHIARWDGQQWSALDIGTNDTVRAFAVFDDGDEASLIIGGDFTEAGGIEANHVARWDGSQWHSIGAGFDDAVYALTNVDGDNRPDLVAGGAFSESDGVSTMRVAAWDGEQWAPMGQGFTGPFVHALVNDDLGDGPMLLAGGRLTDASDEEHFVVARWDGKAWVPIDEGVSHINVANMLAVFEEQSGPVLYAGGLFSYPNSPGQFNLVRWTGEHWRTPGQGIETIEGYGAFVATHFDDGGGEQLYLGGGFFGAGNVPSRNLIRWSGEQWSSIGSMTGTQVAMGFHPVLSFATSAIDSVESLYVGGAFDAIDGETFNFIARWDGTQWSPLGDGLAIGESLAAVHAIREFDDGSGPRLIVGGSFVVAEDGETSNIAAWDGEHWSPLGSGVDGRVYHMAVFDDGNGASLYVTGGFQTAGGVTSPGFARWDGQTWHVMGTPWPEPHWSALPLAVHEDKLILGGFMPSGMAADGYMGPVVAFDGETWTNLGAGLIGKAVRLITFNDGSGPALYAGVNSGLDTPMGSLRMWDGTEWIVPHGGVGNVIDPLWSYASALAVSSDGSQLAVGGFFTNAGDVSSGSIAILHGCPPIPGDLNGDGVVNVSDLLILFDNWGQCDDCGDCPADLNGDCVVNVSDLLVLFDSWG
jgi:trimeric autotransporter adhesin